MSKTSSIILVLVILLAVVGLVFWNQNGVKPQTEEGNVSGSMNDGNANQIPDGAVMEDGTLPETGTSAQTYTLAEVSAHNSQSDCWSAINGGVYNLTSWISQHPGGERAILKICGKDGSAAFNDQHGGQQKQADILATFKIGVLQ